MGQSSCTVTVRGDLDGVVGSTKSSYYAMLSLCAEWLVAQQTLMRYMLQTRYEPDNERVWSELINTGWSRWIG